jgi:hypothetical protein
MDKEFLDLKNLLLPTGASLMPITDQHVEKMKKFYDFIQANALFSDNEELQDLSSFSIKYISVPFLFALALTSCKQLMSRSEILENSIELVKEFLSLTKNYGIEFKAFNLRDRGEKLAHWQKLKEFEKFGFLLDNTPTSDEERYREVSTNFVKYCILAAQGEMDMMQREITLLSKKAKQREEPPPSEEKKPIKTLVLESRKLKLQNVFRPGHSLPSMTVQEFYEKAYKDFNFISANKLPSLEKDPESEEEEERIYKIRAKDEYNDWNPKGSGNRLNRS